MAEEYSKLNYVNVGPHGTFKPSGDLHTKVEDIDNIFAHLSSSGINTIAIHFHGGLVREGKGEEIAKSMFEVFKESAHPVTFIWETGLLETLRSNLTGIHETKLFQKLIRYAIRQISKRLGADFTGRGPGESFSIDEIESELSKPDLFAGFESTARGGAARLDENELEYTRREMELELLLEMEQDEDFGKLADDLFAEDPHLRKGLEKDFRSTTGRGPTLFQVAKFLASVVYRVLKRYVYKRDHGFYPTVVEELLREFYLDDFGGWVWGNMKDAAVQMFLPNSEILNQDSHPGTYFLEKLSAHQQDHPDFQVDLVGHSAGSIAICHLFRSLARSGTPLDVRNVIFLAPACTSRLMHDEIVNHPERFKTFRMFTMQDGYEQKDQLVKGIYTRSLLYFISGVLEGEADIPIAGMERFWTSQAPFDDPYLVDNAVWLKEEDTARTVMSVTGVDIPGRNCASESHGNFDNDDLTRKSLTYMVGQA